MTNWFQEGRVSERKRLTPRHLINFSAGMKWYVLLFKGEKKRHWKNKNPNKSTWGTSRAFSFLCTLIKMQVVAFVHVVGHRQLKQICQTLKSKKVTSVNPFALRCGFLTGVYVHCRQWMHQGCCCHWGVSSLFLPHLIPFHYIVFTS